MSQEPPQRPKQPKNPKRTHDAPVSLYGMTFDAAVSKLAKAKRAKPKHKPTQDKPQH
jgi:hypothetical protein